MIVLEWYSRTIHSKMHVLYFVINIFMKKVMTHVKVKKVQLLIEPTIEPITSIKAANFGLWRRIIISM